MPAPVSLQPGETIDGTYRVLAKIAEGGMGTVYQVEHLTMARRCALKTIRLEGDESARRSSAERFQNEAKTISKLNHRSIIKVYDFGVTASGAPYYVMDFIEGKTLSERIREQGQLDIRLALAIFIEVAQGLSYAHSQGLVHRDIKPSNIMLASDTDTNVAGSVKIVDFGLVRNVQGQTKSNGESAAASDVKPLAEGSPPYMSPEQFLGTSIDHRSDIYSFGCALFEALTGVTPFISDSALVLSMKHTTEPPPSLAQASLGREFPRELELIEQRLLAKDPQDRYQSMQVVAEDLQAVLNDIGSGDKPAAARQRTERRKPQAAPQTAQGDSQAITVSPLVSARRAQMLLLAAPLLIIGTALALCWVAGWQFQFTALTGNHKNKSGAAAVRTTPPPAIPTATSPTPAVGAGTASKEPYSQIKIDARGQKLRVFHFPDDVSLGRMVDMDAEGASAVRAQGVVTFGADKHLKLVASIPCSRSPSYFRRFRPDDLCEIDITKNESVTSETINYMDHLTGLTGLSIFETDINDECAATLDLFPHLRFIDISGTEMTGEGLARMKNLKNIAGLRANDITKVDALIEALKKTGTIVFLHIDGAQLTKEDFKKMVSFKNMQTLSVSDTKVDLETLEILSKCPKLNELIVDGNGLKPDSLAYFQKFPHLTVLRINCDNWTQGQIEAFKRGLPQVNILIDQPY
ncbi:MAG: serine/threonine protein kinase [Cyanobacteria bacterium SZAS LIN-3]|nr:serine/threonine protein kinase [Cyanobacteria bacterium SZAS LIN-3]